MDFTTFGDPFAQNITLTDRNGDPLVISMTALHTINLENIQMSLATGTGIGLSVLMLVAILLLTKPNKRQSPIFFLNTFSIILNTIACSIYAAYLTSNWNDPYALISADLSKVTRGEVANSIAYPVVKFIELIVIEISLILQVRAVLCTAQKMQRFWIMTLSISVGLVALGFQCALMILNGIAIASAAEAAPPRGIDQIGNAASVTLTGSVCFFMLIFVAKLGYALKQRHTLGLRKFGPMQVIFIMGLQTMTVPGSFWLPSSHFNLYN
jgi:pheromone alpha factor receptor